MRQSDAELDARKQAALKRLEWLVSWWNITHILGVIAGFCLAVFWGFLMWVLGRE